MNRHIDRHPPPNRRGWCQLAVSCGTLMLIWLFVLPAITRRSDVAARIHRLQTRGIDPSAIFYTELDAMPGAEEHLHRLRNRDVDLLW